MTDSTPHSEATATGPLRRAGNSVLCPTCERLNPLDAEKCGRCGVDLFELCQECGARNPRTSTRCLQCGRNQGNARRSQMKSPWHNPIVWATIVTGLGVIIALGLLAWLGGGHLPRI